MTAEHRKNVYSAFVLPHEDALMTEPRGTEELQLVFTGRLADEHRVPVAVLTDALQGLQRAIHLLAMDHEGVEVRRRDRLSRELERKYALLVSELKPGSVVITAMIGDPASDLFAPLDIVAVRERFGLVSNAMARANAQELAGLVPNRVRRLRVVEAFRSIIPKKGSGVGLDVRSTGGELIVSTELLGQGLKDIMAVSQTEPALQTVTGRLTRIDFDERKVTIVYPPTNRELECIYEEGIEDLLLENPRELIQVTGEVIVDEDNQPKRIVDVNDIREVDLSPFYVAEVLLDDYALRLREPLVLTPELDESQQLLCLVDPSLGLDVCAFTRDELDEALAVEIDILWRNNARTEDDKLTPAAIELKRGLLARMEEVARAAG